MTEQDLIDLGFQKQEQEDEFYYYTHSEFISNTNDEAGKDNWEATMYGEFNEYMFDDVLSLTQIITILNNQQVD